MAKIYEYETLFPMRTPMTPTTVTTKGSVASRDSNAAASNSAEFLSMFLDTVPVYKAMLTLCRWQKKLGTVLRFRDRSEKPCVSQRFEYIKSDI